MELGFSVNKNALVDNMQMETIVPQRKVNDYMSKNNFQTHMSVSKELLQNAKQAHFRYKKALDEKQNQKKKSVGAIQLEKRNSWFECSEKSAWNCTWEI